MRKPNIDIPALWWKSICAAVFAALANAIIFYLAVYALGVTPRIVGPDGIQLHELLVGNVIAASAIPAIIAGLLLALLVRFTAHALNIFLSIAGTFFLLSLAAPLGLDVPLIERLVLVAMHIVALIVTVWTLLEFRRAQ